MSFVRTLRQGKIGENFVMNCLGKFNIECTENTDKKKLLDWDLKFKVGRKNRTCEVKYDVMEEKTGNIAIEIWNSKSNKPSGLYGTKADLWAIVLNDDGNKILWMTSVEKLKHWIKLNPAKRELEAAGDNNAHILLYDNYKILKEFVRLDNIVDEKKMKKALKEVVG